jgi:hypothetical protein
VESKRPMGALLVVVGDEIGKDGRKTVLVNFDEVVQALSAPSLDDSFSHCVCTRRPSRRANCVDADASGVLTGIAAIDSIAISDQMPRLVAPGRGLDHLSPHPGSRQVGPMLLPG